MHLNHDFVYPMPGTSQSGGSHSVWVPPPRDPQPQVHKALITGSYNLHIIIILIKTKLIMSFY